MPATHVLGIDIGGTTVKLALVRAGDDGHSIVQQTSIETRPADAANALVRRIAIAARPLIASAPQLPAGVGVGCPGLIDYRRGVVVICANIPSLSGFALRDELSEALQLPAELQNDANAAAVGEYLFGRGRGTRNLIVLTLGTGVGGGVIVDGQLLTGADNAAAELGHIKIDFGPDAAPCGCGKAGCIEAYAGINGIGRIAHCRLQSAAASGMRTLLKSEGLTTKQISEAARAGDLIARAILHEVGAYLGRGIANLIETFNPEKIVLGGGASGAFDWLLPGIRQSLDQFCCFPFTRDRAALEASNIPDSIGILGPAAVFLSAHPRA